MNREIILVPVDFSEASRNAADYAVELAKDLQYDVLLLHVYNSPSLLSADTPGVLMIDVMQIEKNIREQLDMEAAYLQRTNPRINIRHESRDGMTTDEIFSCEEEYGPAFVVMGMKPAGTLSEYMFGSTITDLFLRLNTPVLVIPMHAKYKKPDRIAFCYDPKLHPEVNYSQSLFNLFKHFGSTVFIVSVVDPEQSADLDASVIQGKLEKHFEDRFHSYHFIESDDITDGVNAFVESNAIDIVTVMPRKHNFFEKIFREPNSKRLAFHSAVPVFAFH